MSKPNYARQSVIAAIAVVTAADIASGNPIKLFELPGNAIVVGGMVTVNTAFNDGAASTLKIGDAAVNNRYGEPDAKAAAYTGLTLTGFKTTEPTDVLCTVTGDLDSTEGQATVIVHYVVEGRAEFTQG